MGLNALKTLIHGWTMTDRMRDDKAYDDFRMEGELDCLRRVNESLRCDIARRDEQAVADNIRSQYTIRELEARVLTMENIVKSAKSSEARAWIEARARALANGPHGDGSQGGGI